MSRLDSISVRVEGAAENAFRTENLRPLLQEVVHALRTLSETGEGTTIDVSAMPFSAQDETDLRAHLGEGEVSATVNAFGPTLVQETALPGVWLVEHLDGEDRRLAMHIEVARVPAILVAPIEDIADGLRILDRRQNQVPPPEAEPE